MPLCGAEGYVGRWGPTNMTAFEFLMVLHGKGWLPHSREKSGPPTRSEVRRWLERKSVKINGKVVSQKDEVDFPVTELVFFEKSKSKTTM